MSRHRFLLSKRVGNEQLVRRDWGSGATDEAALQAPHVIRLPGTRLLVHRDRLLCLRAEEVEKAAGTRVPRERELLVLVGAAVGRGARRGDEGLDAAASTHRTVAVVDQDTDHLRRIAQVSVPVGK